MRDRLALFGVLDELGEPPLPGLLPLGAHSPPDRGLAVRPWLGLEVGPRLLVGAQSPLVILAKHRLAPLLVGVDTGAILDAPVEGRVPGRVHPAELGQLA